MNLEILSALEAIKKELQTIRERLESLDSKKRDENEVIRVGLNIDGKGF